MYIIIFRHIPLAVSASMHKALQSVKKVVSDYLFEEDEDTITFKEKGIIYYPESDSARVTVIYDSKKFEVEINKINEI